MSFSKRRERQEVIEMGRYEEGEEGDLPDLRMGTILDSFHWEGKNEAVQQRLKMENN